MPSQTPNDRDPRPSPWALGPLWRKLAGSGRAWAGWATANRLRAGLVLGACLVSVAGVVLAGLMIMGERSAGKDATLERALDALDGRAFFEARQLAEKLQERDGLSIGELGGPVFVLGAVSAYEAEDSWSKERTRYLLLAARYLEEARDRGFPPGREAEGLYLLGKSLYLGGQIPSSRPVLLSALPLNPHLETEIHRLLAGAYLNDANPMLEKALSENGLYLADRQISAADRHDGLLQRVRILLQMDNTPECLAALNQIPLDARNRSEAIIMRGRVLMHEARTLKNKPEPTAEDQLQARQKYEAAIRALREAQGADTLGTQATRKSMYLIGVCYMELGDDRAALALFARTRTLHADTPEGFAAGLQEAELSRRLGRDEDALLGYRRILGAVTDPENFSNPWIALDELRFRMLDAYQHYVGTQNFEICLQLTRSFYPLFSREQTLALAAEVHRSWGRSLLSQAEQLSPEKAQTSRHLGRAQLRTAGSVYARLARLLLATRQYPDELWNSAQCYLQGQDYTHAIRVLQEYLQNEPYRRHPEALVQLGEAYLSLGRADEASEHFEECIESYPHDVAAYRARLLDSRTHLEQGNLEEAEKLLEKNLVGELLTPEAPEWRDSLFALGELLYVDHRYEEAIDHLDKFVRRYAPEGSQTLKASKDTVLQARYLTADAYRRSAREIEEKLAEEPSQTGRVVYARRIHELYTAALDGYRRIWTQLKDRQDTIELAPLEKSVLRNCYFAIGDVEFAMKQYEAAIKTYSTATDRYQNEPEVLEAFVQIAHAYRKLDEPVKARAALEQAKVVLARMRSEQPFIETTNYDRQQWEQRLDWLSNL